MLTYREILDIITIKLNSIYSDVDIYTTEQPQGFHESCFFVQMLPMTSVASNMTIDNKRLMIEVKYYGSTDRLEAYDKLDELLHTFVRGIKVQNRYLKYNNIDSDITKDDIGYVVTMLLFINYHETVIKDDIYDNIYDNMQEINIKRG